MKKHLMPRGNIVLGDLQKQNCLCNNDMDLKKDQAIFCFSNWQMKQGVT